MIREHPIQTTNSRRTKLKRALQLTFSLFLIYNLVTLSVVFLQVSWVDGWGIGYSRGNNLFVSLDVSSFAEQMEKFDNKPQIIATFYEWSNPSSPLIPTWSAEWRMSADDEIQVGGFVFRRVGEKIQIVNTGNVIDNGVEWNTSWYDLLKNFLIPWHLEKIEVKVTNEGVLHNIVGPALLTENVSYENLDFLFLKMSVRRYAEFSLWGPISFVIALAVLIYVRKKF